VEPFASADVTRPQMPTWLLERPSLRLTCTADHSQISRHRCGRATSSEATHSRRRCCHLRTLVLVCIDMQLTGRLGWLHWEARLFGPQVEQSVAWSLMYCCLEKLHRPSRRIRAPCCRSARLGRGFAMGRAFDPLESPLARKVRKKPLSWPQRRGSSSARPLRA